MDERITPEMIAELIRDIMESCDDINGVPAKVTQLKDCPEVVIADFTDQGRFSIIIRAIDNLN